MIDAAHDLPVARQAEVLDLSRSSVYYRPRPVSPEVLIPGEAAHQNEMMSPAVTE